MTEQRLRDLYATALASGKRADRAACPAPEAILALVRREGAEDERLATLDHVMSCTDCKRDFDLLRSVEQAGAEIEGRSADRSRGRRAWFVPAALAASVMLAVLVGREMTDRGRDDVTRGGSAALALLAPPTEATAGDTLTFVWRPLPGASRYTLEVLTTGGDVVVSTETADTVVTPAAAAALQPGSYRWWVRAATPDGSSPRSDTRALLLRAR